MEGPDTQLLWTWRDGVGSNRHLDVLDVLDVFARKAYL